jgi:hypothetical protein
MSRTYSTFKNKYQKQPKVHFSQYLYNAREPQDYLSHDLPDDSEIELLENTTLMRGDLRDLAKKVRNQTDWRKT